MPVTLVSSWLYPCVPLSSNDRNKSSFHLPPITWIAFSTGQAWTCDELKPLPVLVVLVDAMRSSYWIQDRKLFTGYPGFMDHSVVSKAIEYANSRLWSV
jgi:hypothetical protein